MTALHLNAAKHAIDWASRYDDADETDLVVTSTTRTVDLDLDDAALHDLVSDALYYAEEMGPDNTGDIDYRPAARSCIRALERAGVRWERSSYRLTVTH